MSARSWFVTFWAVLCVGGLMATTLLDGESRAPEKPAPSIRPPLEVDCELLALRLEEDEALAEAARQSDGRSGITQRWYGVPEECAGRM
ncbi:hypothetical protein ACH4E8_17100 [Streptomyces sp. NPDC017979]|uniref:hypothetical protein n=1 Tax=Streptomyces sp. NPDC017979 TaxID=3365024 RepID=UPI0037B0CBDE